MEIKYVDGWPQPYRLPDAEPYWKALQSRQLTYQKCHACNDAVWPPHSLCPHCGAESLQWEQASGRGRVYSYSTVLRGPTAAWAEIAPYTVGFIEMEEGYYLFSQINAAAPEDIKIGAPVTLEFIERGEQILPIFSLTGS